MLLRFLVYFALGIDAAIRRQFILALLCLTVPFAGRFGMWIAVAAGVFFFVERLYWEGAVSAGLVAYNLVGNRLWDAWEARRARNPGRAEI